MKKLFGNVKMGWGRVILFALITGIYTGVVMLIPALKDTSIQDIGISYEWWVIFAVIVVTNCKKGTEAMIKCFLFFLISQPLVYLVQVVAGALTVDLAKTYYFRIWLPATVLTLPGGFVAWQCKKQSELGAAVLGLGNTIQLVIGLHYASCAIQSFPWHLFSAVVSFASIPVMSLCIQKQGKHRCIALLLPVALTACIYVFTYLTGRTFF